MRAADKAIRRLAETVCKKNPRNQRRKRKDRIRNPIGRHLPEASKKDTEDHHRQERLNDGPGRAERGLFVTHLDVAPDKKVEQLAIFPKLIEFERNPALRGRDAKSGHRDGWRRAKH